MGVSGRPRPERAEAPNLRQHGARRELSSLSNTVHVQYERAVTVPCHSSSKNSYRRPTNPVCLSTYTSSHLSGVALCSRRNNSRYPIPRLPTREPPARRIHRASGPRPSLEQLARETYSRDSSVSVSQHIRKLSRSQRGQGQAREVALGSGSGHAGPRCR